MRENVRKLDIVYTEEHFIGSAQTDTHTNWATRKGTNSFQSWEMERNRFSEKSTLAGGLITALSSYRECVCLTFSDRQTATFSIVGTELLVYPAISVSRFSFFLLFAARDARHKQVKSRMIYSRRHSVGAYSRRHGITRCIPGLYRLGQRVPAASSTAVRARKRHPKNITLRYQPCMP